MTRTSVDFEKLGAFYLGRRFDLEAGATTHQPLLLDSRDLTTHAAMIGMTGSGKTGLFIDLIEEAALDQIPALCIDPKGDLANLFLTFPQLRPKDFLPWIDPRQAERKGLSLDAYSAHVASQWKEGLRSFGQDRSRIKRLRESVDLKLYTPKSRVGTPLAVLSALRAPPKKLREDPELFDARVDTAAEGLLTLIGGDAEDLSQSRAFVGALLSHAWLQDQSPSIGELIRMVSEPPIQRIGVLDIDVLFPPKQRTELALRLNAPLARPGFSSWLEGDPLDVQRMLYSEDGKPRVSVISISHLSDRERMFFVTVLLNEVVTWMRQQPGTSSLRALVAMDEVFGFLPPVQEPPSKRLFLTLLKQARAYGVGLCLATQNPVDIDYKALSNTGSWFLGRLQTERDVDRVLDGLMACGAGSEVDPDAMRQVLAGLPKRVFVLNNVHEPGPAVFQTRWAMSYLRGPLTRAELGRLKDNGIEKADSAAAGTPATVGPVENQTPADGVLTARPIVTADIEEIFIGQAVGDVMYQPALLAELDVHHVKASTGIDHWTVATLLTPLIGNATPKDMFAHATRLSAAPEAHPPSDTALFAPLPEKALTASALRRHGASAKRFAYKHSQLDLGRCKKLKLYSEVGEPWDSFMARVQQVHREARDLAVQKARNRFEKRLGTAEAKVERAKAKLAREQGEARQSQLDTALGIGTTVLGAIFGGRSGGVRGAASATRRAGRAVMQRGDVKRAQQALERATADLEELREKAREAISTAANLPAPASERFQLAPRKSDLAVRSLKLAWVAESRKALTK